MSIIMESMELTVVDESGVRVVEGLPDQAFMSSARDAASATCPAKRRFREVRREDHTSATLPDTLW